MSRTLNPGYLETTWNKVKAIMLPSSHFSFLQPQLEGQIGKAASMSPLPVSEVVFQHFECPLAVFVAANPAFDPAGMAQVRFVFDRTRVGVVALDDVGFCVMLRAEVRSKQVDK